MNVFIVVGFGVFTGTWYGEVVQRLLILIFFFMITGHRQFPLAKQHAGCPRCWLSIASAGALLNLQPQGRCQWSSVDSAWISFCSEGVDKNLRLLYGEKFDFCSALVTITGYGEFSV